MKTLQNNFTTPEQSKRLLVLGVPVNSADCFYYSDNQGEEEFPCIIPIVNDGEICFSLFCDNKAVPCWSVGRLIVIYEICTGRQFERIKKECSVKDDILWQIEIHVTETAKGFSIDFSKLED